MRAKPAGLHQQMYITGAFSNGLDELRHHGSVCLAGMLSSLQDMLTEDKDAQVVANCMSVLQQVTQRPH